MKKILVLLFSLLLILPSLTVADAIVEPDNRFFRTHQSECRHKTGRVYIVNGPNGTLNLHTAPGGTVEKTLSNGSTFYCEWVYTDTNGDVWGFSEQHEAWAPMGYSMVQYDHISFEEEHASEIIVGSDSPVMEYATVYLYEYPGATDPIEMKEVDLKPSKEYTDPEGHHWGFVSYIYGIRDKWYSLDDPGNAQLAGEKKEALPSGYDVPRSLPTGSQTRVIVGAVGCVSLVTLIVVLVLFRKKRIG